MKQSKAERSRLRQAKKSKRLKLQRQQQNAAKRRRDRIKHKELKRERAVLYQIWNRRGKLEELQVLARQQGVNEQELLSWTEQDRNMAEACIVEAALSKRQR